MLTPLVSRYLRVFIIFLIIIIFLYCLIIACKCHFAESSPPIDPHIRAQNYSRHFFMTNSSLRKLLFSSLVVGLSSDFFFLRFQILASFRPPHTLRKVADTFRVWESGSEGGVRLAKKHMYSLFKAPVAV